MFVSIEVENIILSRPVCSEFYMTFSFLKINYIIQKEWKWESCKRVYFTFIILR